MNHVNESPVGQTNEVARRGTPKEDGSPEDLKPSKEMKYQFLAEDLQKIRRSNHSSHRAQDAMDDADHDGIIKGLLYPCLEDSASDMDFFEEDYQLAQDAINQGESGTSAMQTTPSYTDTSSEREPYTRIPQNQISGRAGNSEASYRASYLSSMGRPYSDLTNEKLHR